MAAWEVAWTKKSVRCTKTLAQEVKISNAILQVGHAEDKLLAGERSKDTGGHLLNEATGRHLLITMTKQGIFLMAR